MPKNLSVPLNQPQRIFFREYFASPRKVSVSVVATNKNNQTTNLNTFTVYQSGIEVAVPAEYIIDANLPATVKATVIDGNSSIEFEAVLTKEIIDTGTSSSSNLSVKDFGAVGDGINDDTSAIQSAIDSGKTVLVPAGTFRCTDSLLVDPGTHIYLESGARLQKDFIVSSGTGLSFIKNRNFAVKVNGVRIFGEGYISAKNTSSTGNIIALSGNNMVLKDFSIDLFAGGRAIILDGDDNLIVGMKISGSPATTGNGGIRVVGGKRFRGINCHVVSGDDCLQFVPSGSNADPLYDRSISGGAFIGCTGESTAARFIAVSQRNSANDNNINMVSSIVDCEFVSCHGYGATNGVSIDNSNSSGKIDNIRFIGGNVDMSKSVVTPAAGEIMIIQNNASGRIHNILFDGFQVRAPRVATVRTLGISRNVIIRDMHAVRGSAGATDFVYRVGGTDLLIEGGSIDGGNTAQHLVNINLQQTGDNPIRPVVSGVQFVNINSSFRGLNIANCTAPTIKGCRFYEAATGATAWVITNTVTDTTIVDNNLTGLTAATKATDNSTGTKIIRDNRGLA